jgi:hypothetical protein
MGLTSFTPAVGPHSSVLYNLPPEKGPSTRSIELQQAESQPEEFSGVILTSGMGTSFPGAGVIDTTFMLTQNWLALRTYPVTNAGLETAIIDFFMYVTMGGLGTLIETPPTGTKVITTVITSRTCTAYVSGAPVVTRQAGGSTAEIAVIFRVPSGLWTCSDGSIILLH